MPEPSAAEGGRQLQNGGDGGGGGGGSRGHVPSSAVAPSAGVSQKPSSAPGGKRPPSRGAGNARGRNQSKGSGTTPRTAPT